MGTVAITVAYKFVASMMMLAEANLFCMSTGLSRGHVLGESDLRRGGHVAPVAAKDFGGSILTEDYFFGFGWGHLANFYKRGFMPKGEGEINKRNLELSKLASLIDTNGALELATNWLNHLGVDLAALDSKCHKAVFPWKFYPQGVNGRAVDLPVYQVEWRGSVKGAGKNGRDRAVVSLSVFGATKELIEYHVLDDSLFMRPGLAIKGRDDLLAISDDRFTAMSQSERMELVKRFAESAEPIR